MHQRYARKSRCRNGRQSIAAAVVLFAIAGAAQILAPASASALVNMNNDGTCTPISGTMGVGWNGTEFCTPDGGGAEGSGGEPTGGGSEPGTQPGEVIEVTGTAPSRCVTHPAECLPSQVGGGSRQTGAEPGFHARSPRATPRRQARKPARQPVKGSFPAERQAACIYAYQVLVYGDFHTLPGDESLFNWDDAYHGAGPSRGNDDKPFYVGFLVRWAYYKDHPDAWAKLPKDERARIAMEYGELRNSISVWQQSSTPDTPSCTLIPSYGQGVLGIRG
jgi:hypothetical protein